MIERQIVSRQILEYQIKEFIVDFLRGAGVSKVVVKRTPLGEKIVLHSSRPGMVVGRSGKNIKDLTSLLKDKFNLENPQVEIAEVINQDLDAAIVAERIATSLERYGPMKFKSIIHRAIESVMKAKALGVEILVSGKIPSSRARVWRVSVGYLKKCGEPAIKNVEISYKVSKLKSGVVGVVVKIMPPGVVLPDATSLILEEPDEEKPKAEVKSAEKKKEAGSVKEKKVEVKPKVEAKPEVPKVETTVEEKKVEVKPKVETTVEEKKVEVKPKVEAKLEEPVPVKEEPKVETTVEEKRVEVKPKAEVKPKVEAKPEEPVVETQGEEK